MKEFKPIIWLLLRFFGTYAVLTLIYSFYLKQYQEIQNTVDPYTDWVANISSKLLNLIGLDSYSLHKTGETFTHIIVNNSYSTFVNEGCNAISVGIIFVSFIMAFAQKFKTTFLYILVGLILLFITNFIRIVWINYIVNEQPEFTRTAHDFVFPAIIYGMVVILWIVWIKFFVFQKKKV